MFNLLHGLGMKVPTNQSEESNVEAGLHAKKTDNSLTMPEEKQIAGASAVFALLTKDDRKKSSTFRVQSSVLDQVKSFLPLLQVENKKLEALTKENIDIENVADNEDHVEMNIGVFEGDLISDDEEVSSDSSSDDSEENVADKKKSTLIQEL